MTYTSLSDDFRSLSDFRENLTRMYANFFAVCKFNNSLDGQA